MKKESRCCCEKCKKELTSNQLTRHYGSRRCELGVVVKIIKTPPFDMKCIYCQKICKNTNSYWSHSNKCPSNPNRNYKNGMKGKISSKKGKINITIQV